MNRRGFLRFFGASPVMAGAGTHKENSPQPRWYTIIETHGKTRKVVRTEILAYTAEDALFQRTATAVGPLFEWELTSIQPGRFT